jgi:phosphoribosylamine--glycine ligase
VEGIRDYFENDSKLKSIPMVGPGKAGAQLEGSKDFSKQFMLRHQIPTANARTFGEGEFKKGIAYLGVCRFPIVLKADGLAAGKGVIICSTRQEAEKTLREMLEEKKFGTASSKVLIEEFLEGIELSIFVLTDGIQYVVLPEAKDYKRIGEGDAGPNTGGMGAVSPVAFADEAFMQKVETTVVKPTIDGLRKDGIPYRGFIFIGLMNVGGEPYVIEYNVRMGDPETQAVLPRVKNDFVDLLLATAKGELNGKKVIKDPGYAVTVAMASGGYPGNYEKGKEILGIGKNERLIFHAGTKLKDGKVITDGGRVLAVTGRGATLDIAVKDAYHIISGIQWEGLYFRRDIGKDLMEWKIKPVLKN